MMAEIQLSPEKLQERIGVLEELLEINLYLNSTLDLDSLLKLILQVSKQALKVQAVSILLLDQKSGELYFRCALGGSAEVVTPYRLAPGEGIAGAVVKTRQPMVIDEAQEDPRFARRFDFLSGFTTRSLLAVPLWAKDQLIGVLELMNREAASGEVENFTSDDLQKATILANMAAVAIDNAQLYQALSQSYGMVKKAEEVKGQFISVVSHELRTPLVPIHGYAFILRKQRSRLDEKTQDEFLEEIIRQSDHLNMLIEDLFLVNEFESVRLTIEQKPVPFRKLVEDAVKIRKVEQQIHPVQVVVDLPDRAAKDPVLLVDSGKFTHVLVHLLDNAVKFQPEGGPITIKLSRQDGSLAVSVEDRGIGVPEPFREKVFERFFQADSSSTRRFGGTGVGLFIVKKIAEAHGGTVFCEPAPEKGTRITVILPWTILVDPSPSSSG